MHNTSTSLMPMGELGPDAAKPLAMFNLMKKLKMVTSFNCG
jgi:hypothetical protein